MDPLSNIVKQRLAAQQAPEPEHPSADILSAFAEQGLRAAERQHVLSHLAVCPTCRQTIALAAPAEATSTATISRRPAVRFPMPMRWASVAAALAVAIGVGVLSYEHQNRPQIAAANHGQTEQKTVSPTVTPAPVQANSEPVQAPPTVQKSRTNSKSRASVEAFARDLQPTLKKEQNAAVLSGVVGGINSRQKTSLIAPNVADGFIASSVPPPPTPLFSASANGKVSTLADVATPRPAAITEAASPVSPSMDGRSNARLVDATTANKVTRSEFNGPAEISLQQQPSSAVARKMVAPAAIGGPIRGAVAGITQIVRWTITATGKLERRLSDGRFTSIEPAPGVSIRTVAAQGIEVWAAGSQPDLSAKQWQQRPVLFHSSDAGETWMRVDGPWQQSPITTLNLSGISILTVVTSDGSWTTADAGKNWIKK